MFKYILISTMGILFFANVVLADEQNWLQISEKAWDNILFLSDGEYENLDNKKSNNKEIKVAIDSVISHIQAQKIAVNSFSPLSCDLVPCLNKEYLSNRPRLVREITNQIIDICKEAICIEPILNEQGIFVTYGENDLPVVILHSEEPLINPGWIDPLPPVVALDFQTLKQLTIKGLTKSSDDSSSDVYDPFQNGDVTGFLDQLYEQVHHPYNQHISPLIDRIFDRNRVVD